MALVDYLSIAQYQCALVIMYCFDKGGYVVSSVLAVSIDAYRIIKTLFMTCGERESINWYITKTKEKMNKYIK